VTSTSGTGHHGGGGRPGPVGHIAGSSPPWPPVEQRLERAARRCGPDQKHRTPARSSSDPRPNRQTRTPTTITAGATAAQVGEPTFLHLDTRSPNFVLVTLLDYSCSVLGGTLIVKQRPTTWNMPSRPGMGYNCSAPKTRAELGDASGTMVEWIRDPETMAGRQFSFCQRPRIGSHDSPKVQAAESDHEKNGGGDLRVPGWRGCSALPGPRGRHRSGPCRRRGRMRTSQQPRTVSSSSA